MATTTYPANCHCGRVQFTVTLPDITTQQVVRCNCSICTRNGYLLVYPKVEHVKFKSGEFRLGEYRFGSKNKPHKFCMLCGTSILIDFSNSTWEEERKVTAVNIRTFQGIEDIMGKLKFRDVDGKNLLKPPYDLPEVQ